MNTNKFNSERNIICGWCAYNANPPGTTYCQKCGKPLVTASVTTRERITRSTLLVGGLSLSAIVLLLFGVGGYFFWQQARSPTISSTQNISSANTSSSIAFYNSLKEIPNVPEGTFQYGGALVFAPLVAQGTHEAINQAHPKFSLRYTEPIDNKLGSGAGIAMLLNREISFAVTARPVEDAEYSKASQRGFKVDQVAFAIDGVGCYTHPDLSIPGLSVSQLQAIYKGKVRNWKEVGGPDLPIIPFGVNPKTTALIKTLLGSEAGSLSTLVQSTRDYTEVFRKVGSTPGAVGIGTVTLIVGQRTVRPVPLARGNTNNYVPLVTDDNRLNSVAFRDNTYPLTRRISVVIRRDGTPDEAAGVAYANLLLSKEGQQFVEKAGFVPIR